MHLNQIIQRISNVMIEKNLRRIFDSLIVYFVLLFREENKHLAKKYVKNQKNSSKNLIKKPK